MEVFFLFLLFALMAGALSSGYPVAFALPGAAIATILLAAGAGWVFAGDADAFFASEGPSQMLATGVSNLRFYWEPERDLLIAIPLFIFMGIMLQRSKIAEDLLVTMAQLFGPMPGGLGISVVFVGALLAATTGIVGATVVAMGLIALPAMLSRGYAPHLATGSIAASGTLGQIIPPSIVLIILADQLSSATDRASTLRKEEYTRLTGERSMPSEFDVVSASVGDMFMGALLPGLLLVGLYMLYILAVALLKPETAPAAPHEGRYDAAFALRVVTALAPPLTLIFLVLGSIISGLATVAQAGALGSAGALVMAGYRLYEGRPRAYWPAYLALGSLALLALARWNFDTSIRTLFSEGGTGPVLALLSAIGLVTALVWSGARARREGALDPAMLETAKTTSMVFLILFGAAMLTAAFRAFGGEDLVRGFLTSLPGGFWSQFILVMLVIFVLGFFLDFIEIAVVVVPIVAPILLMDPGANVTAIWLGVMIGLNMQTSFLTPPFGFALFYLRGVAPDSVSTMQIYRGVVPFIGLQVLALAIVGLAPPLANYLPQRVALTSENAPPPQNPKLQLCLERFVGAEIAARGPQIRSAIEEMRAADLSALPRRRAGAIKEALEKAAEALPAHAAIGAAETARLSAAAQHRPIHNQARAVLQRIGRAEAEATRLERRGDAESAALAVIKRAEAGALRSALPAGWEAARAAYRQRSEAETNARNRYRSLADGAAEPIVETIALLEDLSALKALGAPLRSLAPALEMADAKAGAERIKQGLSELPKAKGASKLRSALSRARRELRRSSPRRDKARRAYEKALKIHAEELAWRQRAARDLLPALRRYRAAISDTIGVRMAERLPLRHARFIAACQSGHRDVSLEF